MRNPLRPIRRSAGRGIRSLRGLVRDARQVSRILIRDLPRVAYRHPRLALALARAELSGQRDPALLPLVERGLAITRSRVLLRNRARILGSLGELSAARATWQELARRGDRAASHHERMVQGRLTETDPTWLPTVAMPREALEQVSPRRVLHILKSSAPERWSGFTIRTMHNLRAQRLAGLDPVVVTEIGWPRIVGIEAIEPIITFDDVPHFRLDRGPAYQAARIPNDVRLVDNVEAMADVVRETRPAILHAHSGYRGGDHALMALALRERFGIPVVYEVRGLFESVWTADIEMAERSELYARRLAQETRILGEVDGVLAISEVLADELVSRGIGRDRITVIPNGIDPDVLQPVERDAPLRSRLGLDDRFVVGYLGNLDHWREGIDILIGALAELHRRGRREVAVLVVGDGTRRGELELQALRFGLDGSCVFTGRVPHEEVAQYYAQMDVFTNPRVDERAARYITPLKPFEAMALRRPVLVSDLPAMREIVDPPNRGVVAPAGDPGGLADAIERLLDDPAERARIATAGSNWVRSERTWASNGPRYRAAYEQIVGSLG